MNARQKPLGEQLVEALRDAHVANDINAVLAGYLQGLVNDLAGQSPEARALVQYHIDSALRAAAIGKAA